MIRWRHLWLAALAVKIVLAAALPLSNDEAYYWVWSHHLQWSYYDHPAGVAWLLWLGHAFEPLRHILPGYDLEGAVRIPAVIITHLSLIVFKKIIGTSISEKRHLQWLCVVLVSPFFGIGSIIVTPDLPLIITWSLALLAFRRYLDRPVWSNAIFFGCALGIGFCAKYHIVLFVPIAVLYVFWTREWRLLKPFPLVSVIVSGLIFSAPVWGWNATHDWVSFRFQLDHGLAPEARSFMQMIEQFGAYSGAQLALLSPLVIFTMWKNVVPDRVRFLKWFGWGPILFFAWTSLRSPVEANWPIAGHMPLLILASIGDSYGDSKRFLSKAMITLWSVVTLIAIHQAFNPTQDFFGVPAKNLKTYEFVKFNALKQVAKGDVDFYASSYQMAGALSVASERTVPKLAGLNRKDFFDFHESGLPVSESFTVAIEDPWPWPSWIAERGYHETSRQSLDAFTLVTFSRADAAKMTQ